MWQIELARIPIQILNNVAPSPIEIMSKQLVSVLCILGVAASDMVAHGQSIQAIQGVKRLSETYKHIATPQAHKLLSIDHSMWWLFLSPAT
jgi:putative NADH-flavin reductase